MIDKYGYAVIIDLGFGTYITFTAKDYLWFNMLY